MIMLPPGDGWHFYVYVYMDLANMEQVTTDKPNPISKHH